MVSLHKVRLQTAGVSGDEADLKLSFLVLAAAQSFADLFPDVQVRPLTPTAMTAASWGRIKAPFGR